jgi:hypothetical protein
MVYRGRRSPFVSVALLAVIAFAICAAGILLVTWATSQPRAAYLHSQSERAAAASAYQTALCRVEDPQCAPADVTVAVGPLSVARDFANMYRRARARLRDAA